MMVGWEWFPNRKGFVTGLIVSCFGVSSLLWGPLSTSLVNPDSVKPLKIDNESYFSKEIADRFPSMYDKLNMIYAISFLVAISLISRPSDFKNDNQVENFLENQLAESEIMKPEISVK